MRPARPQQRPRGRPRRSEAEEVAIAYARFAGLTRGQIQRRDRAVYERLRRKGLLRFFPKSRRCLADPLRYYRKHYPHLSRGELVAVDESLYTTLRKRGLLNAIPYRRRKPRKIGDPLAYYQRHYPGVTRAALRCRDLSLYTLLHRQGLIDRVPRAAGSLPKVRSASRSVKRRQTAGSATATPRAGNNRRPSQPRRDDGRGGTGPKTER